LAQQAVNQFVSETFETEEQGVIAGRDIQSQRKFKDIIGNSDNMQDVFGLIESVADSDSTIIINGETGTGKGLIAREIHKHSNRRNKPFIQINCGAIPENLLESELFGHVRGAFTGATSPKPGKFELANSGTIFLDEIGDMSHDLQVKLLRVLEEKEFEQVGGCKTIKVDVRVIAATHRDLEEEVQKGNFREDLFYRLYVIPIALPPLRERKADIPLLISHFLRYFNEKNNRDVEGASDEAMEIILNHAWKGNVRELKNMVEGLVVLKGEGMITPGDLPKKLTTTISAPVLPRMEISQEGICLSSAVSEFEKNLIVQCLEQTKWVKKKAAKLLQVNRTTLVEKIKRHQLEQAAASM
jgi:sigma-54 dependent transcriptional regulator, flagellar regulatory protein